MLRRGLRWQPGASSRSRASSLLSRGLLRRRRCGASGG